MRITEKSLPFAVLICALLWGSAFPGIKAIYNNLAENGIETTINQNILIAGVRFTLGGFFLLCISKSPVKSFQASPKKTLLVFALLQTTLQYVCFYNALAVSSAVLGGLLTCVGSFWWLILSPILLRTPWPKLKQWALFIFGALGVCIAVYAPGAGSGNTAIGVPLFLSSTFCGALALIVYQKLTPHAGPRAITGYGLFLGGIILCAIAIPSWGSISKIFTPTVIFLTAYLALVSAIGFGIWNYLSQLFPVNLLAGYRFFIPICAVTEASIFVKGESPGLGILLGGGMILISIIFLQKFKNQVPAGSDNAMPPLQK